MHLFDSGAWAYGPKYSRQSCMDEAARNDLNVGAGYANPTTQASDAGHFWGAGLCAHV